MNTLNSTKKPASLPTGAGAACHSEDSPFAEIVSGAVALEFVCVSHSASKRMSLGSPREKTHGSGMGKIYHLNHATLSPQRSHHFESFGVHVNN